MRGLGLGLLDRFFGILEYGYILVFDLYDSIRFVVSSLESLLGVFDNTLIDSGAGPIDIDIQPRSDYRESDSNSDSEIICLSACLPACRHHDIITT